MSFAGDFGAAAAFLPIARITCPAGLLIFNADGVNVDLQKNGVATSFAIPRINNLRITGSQTVLGTFVAIGDGSTADRGTLGTGLPKANVHSLPSNFGPGRGNWTQADLERLRVHIIAQQTGSLANASIGNAVTQSLTLTGGEVDIVFRNISLASLLSITIDLEYRHTIDLT